MTEDNSAVMLSVMSGFRFVSNLLSQSQWRLGLHSGSLGRWPSSRRQRSSISGFASQHGCRTVTGIPRVSKLW